MIANIGVIIKTMDFQDIRPMTLPNALNIARLKKTTKCDSEITTQRRLGIRGDAATINKASITYVFGYSVDIQLVQFSMHVGSRTGLKTVVLIPIQPNVVSRREGSYSGSHICL